MARIFVAVNGVAELGPRQTTSMLAASAVRLGGEVLLLDVDQLHVSQSGPSATCRRLPASAENAEQVAAWAQSTPRSNDATIESIAPGDLLLIRTNPGRDAARLRIHQEFLHRCRLAQLAGVRVVNDPQHLSFLADKASLVLLDAAYRVPMTATADVAVIANFVRAAECDCVVKPVAGSRGADVLRVGPQTENLESTLRKTFAGRGIVAQHFIGSEQPGDSRVVVLHGELLRHEGNWAGIQRIPADGDFRGNLHAGGAPLPLSLSTSQQAAAAHAAQLLHDHGVSLAGVDLIGDRVIELNVFSTGGLFDASRFADHDFSEDVMRAVATRQND